MMESKKSQKELYESVNMPKAIGKYHELNDLIASISTKLSNVYSHNEKEFLSAYRVHTIELQSELKELKEKVESAEASLNDDDAVAKLEHEVSWFHTEATRLRNQSNSMKKDVQSMHDRIEALKEQRLFLSNQLKAVMKKTRVLEAELENQSIANETDNQSISRSVNSLGQNSYIIEVKEKKPAQLAKLTNSNTNSTNRLRHSESAKTIQTSSHSLSRSKSQKLKPILEQLNYKDTLTQRTNPNSNDFLLASDPKKALQEFIESRSPVEYALEDAITHIFNNEIMPRKVEAAKRDAAKNFVVTRSDTIRATDFTGLGLQYFSETDKMNAMIKFLQNPYNFQVITELLKEQFLE